MQEFVRRHADPSVKVLPSRFHTLGVVPEVDDSLITTQIEEVLENSNIRLVSKDLSVVSKDSCSEISS